MSVVRFTPQIDSYALSHPGRRRSNNEDAYLIDRNLGLFIVCDGMGGHAAGEVASGMARELVHASMQQALAQRSYDPEIFEERQLLRKLIAQAIFEAGQGIFKAGKQNPNQKGMGTTITLCLIVGCKVFLGHVGDSRCYLLRNGRTHQLTEDHTFFNEVRKNQGLEAAKKALQRIPNALSRALGAQPTVHVDTLELDVLPGDRFILCSDGLHGYLDERNIDLHAFVHEQPLPEAPNHLVHFANQMGGKDNITVVALEVHSQQETHDTQKIRTSLSALRHIQLFQQLDYKEHILLFNAFKMNEYSAGDVIIRQGEQGDALYVLVQGQVSVVRDGQMIARMEPGSHFGEMSLIDNSPRSADVIADTTCLLLYMASSEFEQLMHQKPQLGLKVQGNLLRSLAHIVKEQSQQLLQLNVDMPVLRLSPELMAAAGVHGSSRTPSRAPSRPPSSVPPVVPPPPPPVPLRANAPATRPPARQWPDADELDLPFETPTASPGLVASGSGEHMRAGDLPFSETMEVNPFQPIRRTPDPFAETAELRAFPKAEARAPKASGAPASQPPPQGSPASQPPNRSPEATARTVTAPVIRTFSPPSDDKK